MHRARANSFADIQSTESIDWLVELRSVIDAVC
jgi:hypothetical protein